MNPLFLRRVLALDALSCAALGIVMAPAAGTLSPLLGLPEALIQGAGLLLLPLAGFLAWLSARPSPPRIGVWAVILGNLGWTLESFLLVSRTADAMTGLGIAFVVAQAVAVLCLAILEYGGLRRLGPAKA